MQRVPSLKQRVDRELGDARLKIENLMVPKGPNVVRHLALPSEGKSPEWIQQEMNNMDNESGNPDWRAGKLSGAVYRAFTTFLCAARSFPR